MNNFDDDNDGGYYGGGCFSGECRIKMHNGSSKQIKDLIPKKDLIATPDGMGALVKCIVMTHTYN
jgi:hypothetical protein